jgi:hypothetical protein
MAAADDARQPADMKIRAVTVAVILFASLSLSSTADEGDPGRAAGLQGLIEGTRCFAGLPRYSHRPDFRLARMSEWKYRKDHQWIMDGDQRIGILNLWIGEIEMLRAFPPAGAKVEYKMPEVHHWATLQGPRITVVPQGTWSNRTEMTCLQDRGDTLRLLCTQDLGGRSRMVQHFTLRFDPVLGYVWDCSFEMRMDRPQRFEYTNLLTGGLSESREMRKRFQKCIWVRRDGTLCYMYQNPLSMMQSAGPEWYDLPDGGGFVGFVAEREMNPFVEVLRSSPRSTLVTCSQWYDQHVFNLPPTRRGDDGLYHASAEYRFLSLPLPVAKELEDAARTMLPAGNGQEVVGFRQDVVNDFETPIPAGTLYNGSMWGHSGHWDGSVGHSGSSSLRVRGGQKAKPVYGGTALYVETGKRYRLSA